MRDFNVLGYICKFMTHFLTRVNDDQEKTKEGIKLLVSFFK